MAATGAAECLLERRQVFRRLTMIVTPVTLPRRAEADRVRGRNAREHGVAGRHRGVLAGCVRDEQLGDLQYSRACCNRARA